MTSDFTPKLNKHDQADTYIISILRMHKISSLCSLCDLYLKEQILFGSILLFSMRGYMTEPQTVVGQNCLPGLCSSQDFLLLMVP